MAAWAPILPKWLTYGYVCSRGSGPVPWKKEMVDDRLAAFVESRVRAGLSAAGNSYQPPADPDPLLPLNRQFPIPRS